MRGVNLFIILASSYFSVVYSIITAVEFNHQVRDQALGSFKLFQASVERETGKKLKCVCSDNSGEYRGPLEEYY